MSSCLSTLFSTIPTSIIPSFPSPTSSLVVAEIVVGFISAFQLVLLVGIEKLTETNLLNVDAIASLSDQVTNLMKEIEVLKNKK
jgi:hypothetical protein